MDDSRNIADLVSEPRLAPLAFAGSPAWLWTANGARLLFANAAGASLLGEENVGALIERPPERWRLAIDEIRKIAGSLPTSGTAQLARLRSLSTGLGRALLCLCSRYRLADGTACVLIIAQEPVRMMSLAERVGRLIDDPSAAVFARDGGLVHAGVSAAKQLGEHKTLTELGARSLATQALEHGDAAGENFSVRRLGAGEHTLLMVKFPPDAPAEHTLAVAEPEAIAEPVLASAALGSEGIGEAAEAVADVAADDAASTVSQVETPAIESIPAIHDESAPAIDRDQDREAEAEMLAEAGEALTHVKSTGSHKLAPATLDEIAAALAGLPVDDEPLVQAAEVKPDEKHEIETVDALTDEFLEQELSDEELRELEEALGAPRLDGTQDDETSEDSGSRPVSLSEQLSDEEFRELEDALRPPSARDDDDSLDDDESLVSDETVGREKEGADGMLAEIAARLSDRHHALRFVWATDAQGALTIEPGDFATIAGRPTANVQGSLWAMAVSTLGIDDEGRLARAVASRDTFSGISVGWPIEGTDERLPVVLSGLPLRGRDRAFQGYRGFGVSRDAARIASAIAARRTHAGETETVETTDTPSDVTPSRIEPPVFDSESRAPLRIVTPSKNVVPFRGQAAQRALSAGERNAFQEIARQLGARFEGDEPASEAPAMNEELAQHGRRADDVSPEDWNPDSALGIIPLLDTADEVPAPHQATRAAVQGGDTTVLDRLPFALMIYRGDDVMFASRRLLGWTGYANSAALAEAGGIDAILDQRMDGDDTRRLGLKTNEGILPVEARIATVMWGADAAMMLTLEHSVDPVAKEKNDGALTASQASNSELRSILDTATDGVIVVGQDGGIQSANRSAQALFGYDADALGKLKLLDLFAPESHRDAADYLEGLTRSGVASLLNDGREVIGRVQQGGLIQLFMTMGRIAEEPARFCAVFRDITQWKRAEEELTNAKRQAEKASSAKSDFLATISHEIRTPLNAIIGFSEVMMEERLGALGNDRYREYVKDIHTSGEHMISLINDLLDLSKIEAGRLDLTFTKVDINDVMQQCVAIMQPQANRERIIIRTALSPALPPVVADQRSVRQIVLNLLSNSVKFTGAGGQVIVSTALTDQGEAVLRVRDTGAGMSEQDIATALEPFRQLPTSRRSNAGGTGLGLPLTKALSEANRAEFRIKSAINSGTLVEVVFPATRVLSE